MDAEAPNNNAHELQPLRLQFHLPTFKRQIAYLNPDLTTNDTLFVEHLSGRSIDEIHAEARAYIGHIQSLSASKWLSEWDNLIHLDYYTKNLSDIMDNAFQRMALLCDELLRVLRKHGALSINRLVQRLQAEKVLRDNNGDEDRTPFSTVDTTAQGLVFCLIGWLSLLYIPAPSSSLAIPANNNHSRDLKIKIKSTRCRIRSNIPEELLSRPLDELFRSFGELLPKKIPGRTNNLVAYGQETKKERHLFEISHLNVATLKEMAKIEIIWVDSISEHLEFDPTKPSLSLFRCPSFCKVNQSKLSILEIILGEYYEEDERPCEDFSIARLLSEIALSYIVLFRDNRRARKVYKKHERIRAATKSGSSPETLTFDPYLDELCGQNIPSSYFRLPLFDSPVRDTYDAEADFPILKDRLNKVQEYMKGIQPNRFMALWHDQRDLRLWYTIWAVIILSVIGLVIATVSLFLAAVQVNYARLAYELQLKQGPPR